MSPRRPSVTMALALAAMFTIGSAVGCGRGGKNGASTESHAAAPTAKADAAVVTYYYLPG